MSKKYYGVNLDPYFEIEIIKNDNGTNEIKCSYDDTEYQQPQIRIISTKCEHKHNYEYYNTVEPTCTEPGYDVLKCSCNSEIYENPTNPLGHDFIDGVCSRCGYVNPLRAIESSETLTAITFNTDVMPVIDESYWEYGMDHYSGFSVKELVSEGGAWNQIIGVVRIGDVYGIGVYPNAGSQQFTAIWTSGPLDLTALGGPVIETTGWCENVLTNPTVEINSRIANNLPEYYHWIGPACNGMWFGVAIQEQPQEPDDPDEPQEIDYSYWDEYEGFRIFLGSDGNYYILNEIDNGDEYLPIGDEDAYIQWREEILYAQDPGAEEDEPEEEPEE